MHLGGARYQPSLFSFFTLAIIQGEKFYPSFFKDFLWTSELFWTTLNWLNISSGQEQRCLEKANERAVKSKEQLEDCSRGHLPEEKLFLCRSSPSLVYSTTQHIIKIDPEEWVDRTWCPVTMSSVKGKPSLQVHQAPPWASVIVLCSRGSKGLFHSVCRKLPYAQFHQYLAFSRLTQPRFSMIPFSLYNPCNSFCLFCRLKTQQDEW